MSARNPLARLQSMAPRERAMVIGLGVVVVLALAYVLLGGGGDAPVSIPPSVLRPAPSASPSPASTLPPVTGEAFEGRDPFEPLVGASPAPSPGPSGGPAGTARRVSLVDVFTQDGARKATVEVDGTEYTVSEGETFASNYRLLTLTNRCGTFVFGDERFTLCIGQEVRK